MRIFVLLTVRGQPAKWSSWMGTATPIAVTCAIGGEELDPTDAVVTESYGDGKRSYLPICMAHAREKDISKLNQDDPTAKGVFMGWMSL